MKVGRQVKEAENCWCVDTIEVDKRCRHSRNKVSEPGLSDRRNFTKQNF